EQSENRQQRRLAAARRPGNRDVLSFLDLEVNLLERVRFHFIREENLLHAFHLNECAVCVRHDLSFASVRVPETRFHHPGPQIIRLIRTATPPTDRRAWPAAPECSMRPKRSAQSIPNPVHRPLDRSRAHRTATIR